MGATIHHNLICKRIDYMFVPYTDLLNDPFYLLINLVIILGCVIAGYYNVMQYTHAFSRGTKMSLFLVAGLFSPLGKGSYRFLIAWLWPGTIVGICIIFIYVLAAHKSP